METPSQTSRRPHTRFTSTSFPTSDDSRVPFETCTRTKFPEPSNGGQKKVIERTLKSHWKTRYKIVTLCICITGYQVFEFQGGKCRWPKQQCAGESSVGACSRSRPSVDTAEEVQLRSVVLACDRCRDREIDLRRSANGSNNF